MKDMLNVTTVLPHKLLQTNPCIRHNFSTQVFRKRAALCGPWAASRWSYWACSSLGTIFQPMRINSVPDVNCFCNNKNVLRAQSMVWHFVRHPVYCYRIKEVCIKLVIGKKLYTMMHGQKNFKFSFVVCFSFDTGKNSLWLNSLWRPATSSCTVSSVTCLRSI